MVMRKPVEGEMQNCPVRDILDRISDRWSMLVIVHLQEGTLRFSDLRRTIGDISQRMLAQTVRRLEEDGFIARRVYPTVPPRVEYSLTPLGQSLLVPLGAFVTWADEHHGDIRASRQAYRDNSRMA